MPRAVLILAFSIFAVAQPSLAADATKGKALVAAECTYCHGDEVYKAEDRKVDELEELQDKVDMCMEPAGVEWDAARQAEVVEYLNRQFYQLR